MKKLYFTLVTFLFLAVANAQIVNIPDANFKAKLLSASSSEHIASSATPFFNSPDEPLMYVNSFNKVDVNNDGEIQVSEAVAIKYLSLDTLYGVIYNLEGISNFINLEYLDIAGHSATNLNINLNSLTNLRLLNCSYVPTPILDVSGLSNLQSLYCGGCELQNLNVGGLTNLKYLYCPENDNLHNGNLTILELHNLTSLISLNCSTNHIQVIDLVNLINLKHLDCAGNMITNIDLTNLVNLKELICANNQLTTLNTNNSPLLTQLICSGNQIETLFLKSNNLFAPNMDISYNPLIYICADESDLPSIQQIIDNAGLTNTCQVNNYCSFNQGGTYYVIQGSQKVDLNNDGCDTNDSTYPNLKFNITNGTISYSDLISNYSGNYSIPVSTGTHTITPQFENPNYFTASPQDITVNFPITTSPFIQNFCIIPNSTRHDLEVVVIPVNIARPGFVAKYKIKYKNKGNLNENVTVNFNYNDAIIDYISSSVTPISQATGVMSWNVGTLSSFESGEIIVTLNVNSPMETPAVNGGDLLSYTATANGLNTDETPDDNTASLNQVVVNSLDPNDKTCLEGTTINPSMIGKYVHYKIRFENTGTFPATNIVVKDMIDITKFDVETLQITDASHSCVTKITNPDKVEFIFENINLPFDDALNDGYVVFKIKTKPTLAVGSTINNTANIYFDYNFPIVTNTATSTFSTLQNDTFDFDNYFTIYPNPVGEYLNITTKQATEMYSITIYNLIGQQVQTTTHPTETVDVSSLTTGSYIVKIDTDKGVSSSKFVKE